VPHIERRWIVMKRETLIQVGHGFGKIVCRHPIMLELIKKAKRIAQNPNIPVMIRGESGTGKEFIARLIHFRGPTNEGRFLKIDCSTNLEWAFTYAKTRKGGLLESAIGGTVFFDHISNMSVILQSRVAGIIEKKRLTPLVPIKEKEVGFRVIAATNIDLEKALDKGIFREDLYYRLNVISLSVPPLRERKEDILLLAEYFTRRFALKYKRNIKRLSPDTKNTLLEYSWPGNVRELKNAIERAVLMGSGDMIEPEQL
jgi:transcriptional regulator with PAS, ATPase and Fis domain